MHRLPPNFHQLPKLLRACTLHQVVRAVIVVNVLFHFLLHIISFYYRSSQFYYPFISIYFSPSISQLPSVFRIFRTNAEKQASFCHPFSLPQETPPRIPYPRHSPPANLHSKRASSGISNGTILHKRRASRFRKRIQEVTSYPKNRIKPFVLIDVKVQHPLHYAP